MAKRLSKTTKRQYEELLHFIENNKMIITGKTKPAEAKNITKLWQQFAAKINSLGYGAEKTPDQWRKILNEWKVNTRRKSREIQVSLLATGGGRGANKTLTDLEERLLSLMSKIHLGDPILPDSLGISDNKTMVNLTEGSVEEEVVEDPIFLSCLEREFQIRDQDKIKAETIQVMPNFHDYATLGDEPTTNELSSIFEAGPSLVKKDCVTTMSDLNGACKPAEKKRLRTISKQSTSSTSSSNDFPETQRDRVKTPHMRYTNAILKSACESFEEANNKGLEIQKTNSESINNLSSALNNLSDSINNLSNAIIATVQNEANKTRAELANAKIAYFKTFGTLENFDA